MEVPSQQKIQNLKICSTLKPKVELRGGACVGWLVGNPGSLATFLCCGIKLFGRS
jgi:hypothetical protein